MTAANFASALAAELVYEGGKVDNPKDPGGRTNQGVTQRVFGAFLSKQAKPTRDVYTMTNDERDAIYKEQYWNAIQGDKLPAGVDLVVFDGAINSGVSQSIKWLQRALNVAADGIIGAMTLNAITSYPDDDELIRLILVRRMAFLRALKTFGTFGAGWTARVNHVRALGQAWAMGSVGPTPLHFADGNVKAEMKDAKTAPPRAPADAVASGGVVTTTLTGVQQSFAPLADAPVFGMIVKGLIVLGVVLGALGLLYGVYARRRKAELDDALDSAPTAAAIAAGEAQAS